MTNEADNTVSVISTSTTVTIAGAGTTAGHEWLSANGRYTFAAFEGPGAGVAVVDNKAHAVVATYPYPGGGRPHGVYYDDPAATSGPSVALASTSARATGGAVPLRVACGLDSVGFCRGYVARSSPGHPQISRSSRVARSRRRCG